MQISETESPVYCCPCMDGNDDNYDENDENYDNDIDNVDGADAENWEPPSFGLLLLPL